MFFKKKCVGNPKFKDIIGKSCRSVDVSIRQSLGIIFESLLTNTLSLRIVHQAAPMKIILKEINGKLLMFSNVKFEIQDRSQCKFSCCSNFKR